MSVEIKTVTVSPDKKTAIPDTKSESDQVSSARGQYLGDGIKLSVGAILIAVAITLVLYEELFKEQNFTPIVLIVAMMMLSAGMTLVLTTFIESKISSEFKVKFFGNEVPLAARGETMVMLLIAVGLMVLLAFTGSLENDLKKKRDEAKAELKQLEGRLKDTEGTLRITEGHRTIYENVMAGGQLDGAMRILRFGIECKDSNVRIYDWVQVQRDGSKMRFNSQLAPLPVRQTTTEYSLVKDVGADAVVHADIQWDSDNGVIDMLLTVDDTVELKSFCDNSTTDEDAGTWHDAQDDDRRASLTAGKTDE